MNYKIFLVGVLWVLPISVFAVNPSVQSFTVNNSSSTSINSGQIASFSWRVADGGGYSFLVPCVQGIKFKKADGSAFACDTPVSSTATASDYIEIIAWNLTGGTRSFTARITPKDASEDDYSYGRQDSTVTVSPISNALESMAGMTTIASKDTYTLSWSSSFLDGVNFSISCSNYIRTTSPSYSAGYLPCNTPIFSGDLAGSGSLSLVFDNSSPVSSNITLTLLPAMAPGVYNGAGSKSLTVSVETNVIPDPVTTSFTASDATGRIISDTPITLSWVTEKSNGANFRISCNSNIATTITADSASSTPTCSALAFETARSASGSATVSFTNKSYASETITITLVPGRKAGGFDATRGKELSFSVIPKSMSTPPVSKTSAPIPSPTPATIPGCLPGHIFSTTTGQRCSTTTGSGVTTSTPSNSPTALFTLYLKQGSSNTEVHALQEFLAKDSAVYPEAVISGYFGPATERAVKRLQVKYSIANAGTAGYGAVGPKTRVLLNSLNK